MAERPKAMPNRIADGMVEQIANHARDYQHLWAKVPAVIKRGVGASWDSDPRPAIYVSSTAGGDLTEQLAGGLDWHRSNLALVVAMVSADADNPEGAIEDLAADVRRALMANRQLEGIDGVDPVLASGRLILGPCRRAADIDEGSTGLAVAFQDVIAEYQWLSEAP